MSANVFVNGRAMACKAADGTSVAAFPDVCLSPPSPPAGPVPIPYPNTGFASDCSGGSKTVKFAGKEGMLRDKSYYKKSTGNEAATRSFGANLVTHQITGKVFFASWADDTTVEGEEAVRAYDITTGNHGSTPPGSGPTTNNDGAAPPMPEPDQCRLRPHSEGCPPDRTPHHCVPDHCFRQKGKKKYLTDTKMSYGSGLCVCVEGSKKSSAKGGGTVRKADFNSSGKYFKRLAQHGRIHMLFDNAEKALGAANKPPNTASLGELEDAAGKSIAEVTGCDPAKLKDQMRAHHEKKGLGKDTRLRADPTGKAPAPANLPASTVGGTSTGW